MQENNRSSDQNYFGDSLNSAGGAGEGEFTDFVEQRAFEPEAGVAGAGKMKISRANLLLIGLFAAGIGFVWFLSQRNGPTQASAQDQAMEAQVNQFISQVESGDPVVDEQGQEIIQIFYRDLTRRQVPLEQLRVNPFVFARPAGEDAGPAEPTETEAELARRRRIRQLQDEARRLSLQSIMSSSRGATAIVDNELVRQGQSLGSFTVESITAETVVLRWEDQTFTLRMVD
jgi:hypothetical protein